MNSSILATDTVVFNVRKKKLKVLLIKMNKEPFKEKWALPGGFVWTHELCENAATRILYEATNVDNLYLEQLKVFDAIDRDPKNRIVSVAYMAIIKKDDMTLKVSDRYTDIAWFPIDELPQLAYDHEEIISYCLTRLTWKITYSTLSLTMLPDEFTLTEIQEIFEIILKKKIDKRNFRKKLLRQGLIEETWNKKTIWVPRPAVLYRAVSKELVLKEMI
jgi:8-oxo-dGTP diphosphatase